ncbi:MAG: TolC family protein [Candidatus Sericytochromatia bacterium]
MKRLLTLPLALILAAGPAMAQAERLTLGSALETARASAPQLRQAAAERDQAEASARQSRAGLLPSLSIGSGYQFGPSRQNVNQVGVPLTNLGNYSVGVNASQLVYDFGQAGYRYEAAQSQVEAQSQSAKQTLLTVTLNVRTAFFAARANQTLVTVAEETLKNQLRHQSQIQNLVAIGTRPPIDLAQARTDVASARLQLINAQNAYQTAKAQLNQAMGVERDTRYTIADEGLAPVAGEEQPLEALLEEAIAHRPDLAAMAARLEAQALLVQAAERNSYPSLNAGVGAGTNGSPISSPNNNWNAGMSFSWPLYTGGAREAQADQARASLASLRAQADALRQQLRLTVEQARLRVVAAKAAVAAAAETVRNARVRLDLAEGRYGAGVGSVLELGDAQLAYTNAQASAVQEQYNLASARAQLLQALGRE